MKLKNIIFTVEIKGRELRRIILRTYENKDELKNEINKSFAKYISEFDIIPESLKDKRVEGVDRTPAENLAYQVGWTTLVLKWESDERKGLHVKTPSDDFKWNQRIIPMVHRYICASVVAGVERYAEREY